MSGNLAKLDDKGRCCGRKPLVYKRPPLLFCCRCDRAYAADGSRQIPNWAWDRCGRCDGLGTVMWCATAIRGAPAGSKMVEDCKVCNGVGFIRKRGK